MPPPPPTPEELSRLVRELQAHALWLAEAKADDLPMLKPAPLAKATPAASDRRPPSEKKPSPAVRPEPHASAQPRGAAQTASGPAGAGAARGGPQPASVGLQAASGTPSGPRQTLPQIRADLGDCTRCRLHETRTQIVFGVGNPQAELVFVGEGPGADEDLKGEPFVGRAGQLLDKMIEAMGFARADVYICNVVKCRPPANRAPERDEMDTCSPFLRAQLRSVLPKVIVVLGATAAQALLSDKTPITRLRGRWREVEGIPVMPTFHPAYLLRSPGEKAKAWEDLKAVVAKLGRTLPGKS